MLVNRIDVISQYQVSSFHPLYVFAQILQRFPAACRLTRALSFTIVLMINKYLALFDEMMKMKTMWEELGKFENPVGHKEAFEEIYNTLRSETNNLVVRVNYALTE